MDEKEEEEEEREKVARYSKRMPRTLDDNKDKLILRLLVAFKVL